MDFVGVTTGIAFDVAFLVIALGILLFLTHVIRSVLLSLLGWVTPGFLERYERERAPRIAVTSLSAAAAFIVLMLWFLFWALPRFASSKDNAYLSAMKADLRILVRQQQAHLEAYGSYATGINELAFQPSRSVVVTVVSAAPTGGVGTAETEAVPALCAVAWGQGVNPVDSTTAPGTPACSVRRRSWREIW